MMKKVLVIISIIITILLFFNESNVKATWVQGDSVPDENAPVEDIIGYRYNVIKDGKSYKKGETMNDWPSEERKFKKWKEKLENNKNIILKDRDTAYRYFIFGTLDGTDIVNKCISSMEESEKQLPNKELNIEKMTDKELKNLSISQLKKNKEKIIQKFKKDGLTQKKAEEKYEKIYNQVSVGEKVDEIGDSTTNYGQVEEQKRKEKEAEEAKNNYIYKQPGLNDSNTSTTDTIDGIITDGRDFISSGKGSEPVSSEEIQKFSQTLYNILITIAIAVSVIIGGILGIKLMTSSAEEKAEVKQFLVPYVMGCIVVFGAFGIWKLIVTILQNTKI